MYIYDEYVLGWLCLFVGGCYGMFVPNEKTWMEITKRYKRYTLKLEKKL